MKHTIDRLRAAFYHIFRSPVTLAFVLFFVIAAAATYPFIIHPRTTLTAPVASDESSSVVLYGAFVREGTNPFFVPRANSIAVPDGIKNNVGVNRVSFLSVLYLWLASLAFGPIMAHSLETFLGFLLTAFITFLFIRSVTKSNLAGFVGGLVYGFWPYMLGLGRSSPAYTHMWLFILPLWAFWLLATKGITKKRVAIAFASILPAMFWTPYFAFHIFLVAVACLAVTAWYSKKTWGTKKTLLLTSGLLGAWLLAYGGYYLIGMSNPNAEVPIRTLTEAYQQSAQPLMFVLPGEFSVWNQATNDAVTKIMPPAAQTSLYVGISVLALAAVAVIALFRKSGFSHKTAQSLRPVILMSLAVAGVCFLFSMPPSISVAGQSIPMPNQLVTDYVPALRAGQRLVIPLMGALAVLASIGAYFIISRYPGRAKYVILAAIVGILCIDLWSPYPNSASRLTFTPAIGQLKAYPEGRVAQYRLGSLVGFPGQATCIAQLFHEKPIINDCGIGRSATDETKPSPQLAPIVTLPLCDQQAALRALAVRYVIVANDDSQTLACFTTKPIIKDSTYQIFRL